MAVRVVDVSALTLLLPHGSIGIILKGETGARGVQINSSIPEIRVTSHS